MRMFQLNRDAFVIEQPELSLRAKILMTLSNFLMLLGIILLLYVGGLYATAEYSRYAARGDTDLPPPPVVVRTPSQTRPSTSSAVIEQGTFMTDLLDITVDQDEQSGRVIGSVPKEPEQGWSSRLTRVMIPTIGVDSKIVTVGWEFIEQSGQQMAIWQVAEFAVGHHLGSANPGDQGNIVLAGHVGGYGKVFKNLIKLEPGDRITLYSAGQEYLYVVSEKVIVNEDGVSPEQQAANARYIQPTDEEMITMITCWPPSGKDRFKQRIIVRARPFHTHDDNGIS